jgi:hypothetical protein
VVACVSVPHVPHTLMKYVPGGFAELVVIASVEVPEPPVTATRAPPSSQARFPPFKDPLERLYVGWLPWASL